MRIYGIDFTSSPKRKKPITCLACTLEGMHLKAEELKEWRSFGQFEAALEEPGPWIAGIDFPFGQARRFIETIGWPKTWQGYVDYVSTLTRKDFRNTLDAYRQDHPTRRAIKNTRDIPTSPPDQSARKSCTAPRSA